MSYTKKIVYILIIEETRSIYIKSKRFEKKQENRIFMIYADDLFLTTENVQNTKIHKLSANFINSICACILDI